MSFLNAPALTAMNAAQPIPGPGTISLRAYALAGEVAAYIEQHAVSEPALLQTQPLARYFGCCEKNIRSFFRNRYGLPIHQYVLQVRHRHVCQLMAQHRHSIKEIAFELGYQDLSNFSRDFSRMAGISPSRYRHRIAAQYHNYSDQPFVQLYS